MDGCKYEASVLDGKKSLCNKFGHWTNCREVGHCVFEAYRGQRTQHDKTQCDKEPEQLSMF